MSRSIWKGPHLDNFLLNRNLKISNIKIWSRRSSIPFYLLDKYVNIYNGKLFKKILITRDKIGFKFGEFSFTRNFTARIKKKK